MIKHTIDINKERCIGCGMCEKDCVACNIEIMNGKASVFSNDCIMCGHCAAICPKQAITISGYEESLSKSAETRLNPEEVMNVIRSRRTMRQFQDKQIPKEIIEQILEAGRVTHTAKNMQDVSFIVLDKEKSKVEQMAVKLFRKIKPLANLLHPLSKRKEIDDNFFFFQAPIVIVIASKQSINGALAAQNMEFIAEANGLGVLFSGFFSTAANHSYKIRKTLGIPKGKKVVTALVLGYPKVTYHHLAQRERIDVKYR